MASFDALFPPASFGPRPVVILDGGMGTTLQAPPFVASGLLESSLWSSELLRSNQGRQLLTDLHQTWTDSGAEILGSCTYQSSLPLFLPSSQDSYTPADVAAALETMISALPLVTASFTPSFTPRIPPCAAFSLGPFGAQLQPAQEYTGLYPPPFGSSSPSHLAYSDAAAAAVPLPHHRVTPTADPREDQLVAWHLARLEHFATSSAFEKLALIAFETTPNLYETRAIRRAVALFNEGRSERKPFYIAYVFPLNEAGQPAIPDVEYRALELAAMAKAIIEATFGPSQGYATPAAIGINCTSPTHLEILIQHLSTSLASLPALPSPWLVLYPDGGAVYDVITRTWSNPVGMDEQQWATVLVRNVGMALELRCEDGEAVWGGVVAGGCCKAGPSAIETLRRRCEEEGLL